MLRACMVSVRSSLAPSPNPKGRPFVCARLYRFKSGGIITDRAYSVHVQWEMFFAFFVRRRLPLFTLSATLHIQHCQKTKLYYDIDININNCNVVLSIVQLHKRSLHPTRRGRNPPAPFPCLPILSLLNTKPQPQTRSAREAFVRNHPLPEPHSYEENLKDSPNLIEELERALWKLDSMIGSSTSVAANGKLSQDDITFFPRMRGLTIIRDLGIPPKLRAYLDAVSELCDIPL